MSSHDPQFTVDDPLKPKTAEYAKVCHICKSDQDIGLNQYIGDGLYAHYDCDAPRRTKRDYPPRATFRVLPDATVPQCTCVAGELNVGCSYAKSLTFQSEGQS